LGRWSTEGARRVVAAFEEGGLVDAVVRSLNGVPIGLSFERWMHIVEHHDDLAGYYHVVLETVGAPDAVYDGESGELLAISKRFAPQWLVVAYREVSPSHGFVITAFFTSRTRRFERRRLVWKRESS
jgi:hypothetical protein